MKLRLERDDFLAGVEKATMAISRNSTLPILACLLVETSEDEIKFCGTNLDIFISVAVPAKVQQRGTTALPARLLLDIARSLSTDSEVIIETEEIQSKKDIAPTGLLAGDRPSRDQWVKISSRNSDFRIKGFPVEDFPQQPSKKSSESKFRISQKVLKEMIAKVAFAASKDETRPVLMGALLEVNDKEAKMAATDSYRLVETKGMITPLNLDSFHPVIIPSPCLILLSKILPEEDVLEVTTTGLHVIFDSWKINIAIKRIEGIYPNYQKLIPDRRNLSITIQRDALLQVVRRAMILSRNHGAGATFEINKDSMEVGCNNEDGAFKERVEDCSIEYLNSEIEDLRIGLNPGYISDFLKVAADEVGIDIIDPLKPVLFHSKESNDSNKPDYRYLLMPVRLT